MFLTVAAVTLGVLGARTMAASDVPIFAAGALAIGSWGVWVVLAAAWLITLTEAAGDVLTAARVALPMGRGGTAPLAGSGP